MTFRDALGAAAERRRPTVAPTAWPWADAAIRCTRCDATGLRIRCERLERRCVADRPIVRQTLWCASCEYVFDQWRGAL